METESSPRSNLVAECVNPAAPGSMEIEVVVTVKTKMKTEQYGSMKDIREQVGKTKIEWTAAIGQIMEQNPRLTCQELVEMLIKRVVPEHVTEIPYTKDWLDKMSDNAAAGR